MMTGKVWRRRSLLFLFILFINAPSILAQDVKVRAGFLADSLRVGDEILFYLTASYPRQQQLVFPDTTFSFTPFELKQKEYFPTQTRDTISYDSAVYSLRTFEINKEQTLRLPVFLINTLDCTRVYSNRDTITLKQLIKQLPDSFTSNLPVKATIAYQKVPKELNVALIIIISSFLLLITGIAWVVLGPRLSRHYKLKKLQKAHSEFNRKYTDHVVKLRNQFTQTETESAVVLWKKYMESLSQKPFTKLTTTETMRIEKDEFLGNTLRRIDGAIYGSNTDVYESLEALQEYADKRFKHILKEVSHG